MCCEAWAQGWVRYQERAHLVSCFGVARRNRLSRCCLKNDILLVSLRGWTVIWESGPLSATVDPVLYALQNPPSVWDVVSAWQSVWIVLNVDINQDTVLDSCHPGSPQLWCQIPFSDHRRRGILCSGSARPWASHSSRLMFWQMPLSKNIIMQAASVNQCAERSPVYGVWQR